MKKRQSLVSNSSTSSFVLYGFKFPLKDFNREELVRKFCNPDEIERFDKDLQDAKYRDNVIDDWFYDLVNRPNPESDFRIIVDGEEGFIYAGKLFAYWGSDDYVAADIEIDPTKLSVEIYNIQDDLKIDKNIKPKIFVQTIAS